MLNEKDLKILDVLKRNAKLSTQQISKKTLIPITTVHNRIKKLEKEGIIKGYTILLDNKKMGKYITAFILINVVYNIPNKKINQEDLAKELKKFEVVEEVNILAGGSDIIIKVRTKDIEELNDFIIKRLRNIEGIDKTQTMIVLKEV